MCCNILFTITPKVTNYRCSHYTEIPEEWKVIWNRTMNIRVQEFVLFGLRMGKYLSVIFFDVMNRVFKHWWSSIPPISTKRTITSHFNWIYWTYNKWPRHITSEVQVPAWDKHKNAVALKRLLGSQPSPLDNWISNDNT